MADRVAVSVQASQDQQNNSVKHPKTVSLLCLLKGELQLKISLLHMKVITLIKAKVMFFFDTCNAVAAREDRKQKY